MSVAPSGPNWGNIFGGIAERVGEVGWLVDRLCLEMTLHASRKFEVGVSEQGQLLDRLALVGIAFDLPTADLPLEVVDRALERGGGDDLGLLADPL